MLRIGLQNFRSSFICLSETFSWGTVWKDSHTHMYYTDTRIILKQERLAMHCNVLSLNGMLNEDCWAPERKDACPISQSASTWGIFTPSGHPVLVTRAVRMGMYFFAPSIWPLDILHPAASMQSAGPIVFWSSPLKSNNHTNGLLIGLMKTAKRLCAVCLYKLFKLRLCVKLKSFIILFCFGHTFKPRGKYIHNVT
jgi:hypothetical protein